MPQLPLRDWYDGCFNPERPFIAASAFPMPCAAERNYIRSKCTKGLTGGRTLTDVANVTLLHLLAQNSLFAGLSEASLQEFAARARERSFAPGEVVMTEGEQGHSLFLVVSGLLRVTVTRPGAEPAVVASLQPGEIAGEIAVLMGDRRSATVIAEQESRLLELRRSDLEDMLPKCPVEVTRVFSRVLEKIEQRQLSAALHRNPLFAPLPADILHDLAGELQSKFLAGGDTLFQQGDTGDSLYMIVSGRLRVTRKLHDHATNVADLGAGETIGENAILGTEQRLATAVAIRDTQLAVLSKEGFHRILGKHALVAAPLFTRRFLELATKPSLQRASARTKSVAVVALTPGLDLHAFTLSLAAALEREQRVLHLTSRRVDELLGPDRAQTLDWDPRHTNLLVWLNTKEYEYDCLLYETDLTPSPWSERCLRQADRVLLVADVSHLADAAPFTPNEYQSVNLALLHPEGKEPSNTAEWLRKYPIANHHHLHPACEADFDRLARFLTGRAIGVVLGGGFARGLAHVGVLRALRELDIPIDAIGGTSLGSLIALEYAFGFSYDQMIDITCRGGMQSLRDWTLPVVALFTGKKVRQVISSRTNGKNIEDLWLPCFTVATNLTHASIAVITEGPADEAILASSRVPGMFPPIVRRDDLLVDGALMSNVPADVMKPFCGGTVISVDVSSKVDFSAFRSESREVSGWRLLFDRLRASAAAEPPLTIVSVLMRAMELETDVYRERMRSLSDVYLTPPVQQYRFNDFKRGRQIAETAYQYALGELRNWSAEHDSGRPSSQWTK